MAKRSITLTFSCHGCREHVSMWPRPNSDHDQVKTRSYFNNCLSHLLSCYVQHAGIKLHIFCCFMLCRCSFLIIIHIMLLECKKKKGFDGAHLLIGGSYQLRNCQLALRWRGTLTHTSGQRNPACHCLDTRERLSEM